MPYVESAGFFADTIAYTLRKFIWSSCVTFWYAAAAANDREQVGLSLYQFNPVASGANPYSLIGIDDDYNGRPPGWEVYITYVAGSQWARKQLRATTCGRESTHRWATPGLPPAPSRMPPERSCPATPSSAAPVT